MLRVCQEGPLIGTPGKGTNRHLPHLPEAEQSRGGCCTHHKRFCLAGRLTALGTFPWFPGRSWLSLGSSACSLLPRAHTAI